MITTHHHVIVLNWISWPPSSPNGSPPTGGEELDRSTISGSFSSSRAGSTLIVGGTVDMVVFHWGLLLVL